MGASVIPAVGAIISSVVVSKAVQTIGPKLGLSEGTSNLLGTVAGAVAGGYTYKAAGATAATTPPPDLSAATGAPAVSNIPGTPLAPGAPPVSNIAGTPLVPGGSPYASAPGASAPSRSGLLSMPETSPPPTQTAPPATQVGAGGNTTARRIIESETVGDTPATEQKSWMERLFSPEKTMDLAMAGLQGYGQAGILQEQMEYPEKIAERNAAGWAAAYPGQKSLKPPQFPSQGGG